MVNVRDTRKTGVQMAAHRHSRRDHAIAVEFPAMHVLIPAALELCRYRQARGVEIISRLSHNHDCIGINPGNERGRILPGRHAVWRRVFQRRERGSAAVCVQSVFESRGASMIGHEGKRLAAAPEYTMALEIRPPDFETSARGCRNFPKNRPASSKYVVVVSECRHG